MKNQNLGDNRDLLKFDLACRIVQEGLVQSFTYVPMLTPDNIEGEEVNTRRGEASGGAGNQTLVAFLDRAVGNEDRNVKDLEAFFPECGIKGTVYAADRSFNFETRKAYFASIGKDLLTNALVLLDPDKGLEEDVSGTGNLMFSDLKYIYDRLDKTSLLMFTQRFPYDLYEEYLAMRTAEIKDRLPGSQPISIDDLDSIIFFLAKDKILQRRLLQVLQDYTREYGEKRK